MVNDHQDPIGPYFVEMCKLKSKAWSAMKMEEEEEAPTELDTVNSSGGFAVVLPDRLTVQYCSVNLHDHDVGAVQANRPAPVKRLVYYFEMTVKNAGAKGKVSIGYTCEGYNMRRQPGWEANSYGYHGEDGKYSSGQGGNGEDAGPKYKAGDTVGAGINYARQEVFFTLNGVVAGRMYKDVKVPLYPTVAVHSQNEEVSVNFGNASFLFDLKEYEAQERATQEAIIERFTLPQNVSYGIVRSYLQHYGYEDTLNSFDMASKSNVPPISLAKENGSTDQETYELDKRKILRQLIKIGKIDDTFGKLRDWYPQIVQDNTSATCFLLHCQEFIELVRGKKLEEAVTYGRKNFEKFYKLAEFDNLVKDCAALLAYEQPEQSTVGYLLLESQREVVADAVNAMILSTNPSMKDSQGCLHSHLERLLRQLTACYLETRSFIGDQGEAFDLHKVVTPAVRKV